MEASYHQVLEMFIRDHPEQWFPDQIFLGNIELTKLMDFITAASSGSKNAL